MPRGEVAFWKATNALEPECLSSHHGYLYFRQITQFLLTSISFLQDRNDNPHSIRSPRAPMNSFLLGKQIRWHFICLFNRISLGGSGCLGLTVFPPQAYNHVLLYPSAAFRSLICGEGMDKWCHFFVFFSQPVGGTVVSLVSSNMILASPKPSRAILLELLVWGVTTAAACEDVGTAHCCSDNQSLPVPCLIL